MQCTIILLHNTTKCVLILYLYQVTKTWGTNNHTQFTQTGVLNTYTLPRFLGTHTAHYTLHTITGKCLWPPFATSQGQIPLESRAASPSLLSLEYSAATLCCNVCQSLAVALTATTARMLPAACCYVCCYATACSLCRSWQQLSQPLEPECSAATYTAMCGWESSSSFSATRASCSAATYAAVPLYHFAVGVTKPLQA